MNHRRISKQFINIGRGAFCASAVLLVAVLTKAAAEEMVWVRTFDSGFWDCCATGRIDSDGNIVLLVNCASDPESDSIWAMVVKFNSDGDTVWTRLYDSDAILDEFYSLTIDAQGNIYIAGIFSYGLEGGGQILKYDRDGNLLWCRRYQEIGDYDYVFINNVFADTGGVIVTGVCGYLGNPPMNDLLIIKLTSDGREVWSRIFDFGGRFYDGIVKLFLSAVGMLGVGVTGDWGTESDILIVQFGPDGDTLQHRVYDFYPEEPIQDAVIDRVGNLYIGGWALQQGTKYPVLIKISPVGEPVYNQLFISLSQVAPFSVSLDSAGNVLLAGSADIPPGWHCGTALLNCSYAGELCWERIYRVDSTSWAQSVWLRGPDTLYLIGNSADSIGEEQNAFVLKLRYPVGVTEAGSAEVPGGDILPGTLVRPGAALRFSVPVAGAYRLVVRDVSGQERLVYAGYLPAGENCISLPSLPAGVYFLELAGAGVHSRSRLVMVR
uniref:T9SS type A sorting domain-containing protein n=1 Tax=candidate division WOR-3 bacterium TaxID=2052148 RepID=A0A7C3IW43_UNCW3